MSTDIETEEQQDELLGELVDALDEVDVEAEDAELNSTTISDNNGERIELTGEDIIATQDLNL